MMIIFSLRKVHAFLKQKQIDIKSTGASSRATNFTAIEKRRMPNA